MYITLLQTLAYILILYIAYWQKEHQRTILWTVGSVLLMGTLLYVGLGLAHPKDLLGVWNVLFPIVTAAIYVLLAEKLRKREAELQRIPHRAGHENGVVSGRQDEGKQPEFVLPAHLNTELAQKAFRKAIDEKLIEWDGNRFQWSGSEVLLAYLCGRIYCGDTSAYNPNNKRYTWKRGKMGGFPDKELNDFFGKDNLGTSRNNRIDSPAPKGYQKIDEIHEAAL